MRNSLLLVLVMAIWMGVMWYVGDCPGVNSALPGISKPSMAVQFARSEADVITALSFPGNCWTAVRHQQYFDFVYILLYWSFFFFVIGGKLRGIASENFQWMGTVVRIFITLGAACDILENIAILSATSIPPGHFPAPIHFSVPKWFFVFLAAVFSGPLFFASFQIPVAGWPKGIARILGAVYLVGAALGITWLVRTLLAQRW